jgi:REP element-mobilizing transposase RayT
MSHNYYSEIFLHLTWHTKLSRHLLTQNIETLTRQCLREKAAALGDIQILEIGGIETHVHLAVTIEPTVTISEMVGALKGYSSYAVNRRLGMAAKALEWQTGYGVVSFGAKDLPWVTAYIQNQREHHSRGSAQDRLERITQFDDPPS